MNMNLKVNEFEQEYTTTSNIEQETATLSITADMGSTGTRTVVFQTSPNFAMSDVVELDSSFSIVDGDVGHLQSKSKQLIDLLEIEIVDMTEGKPEEFKVFPETTRILKGGIMRDQGSTIETTVSDIGKSEQRATFVNLISNIGLRLFMQQSNTRQRNLVYDVDLTVALTNEDTQNLNRLNKFKMKLSGMYLFRLPRLGYEAYIKINEKNIFIEDESLAVLRYWATFNAADASRYNNVLVVDGGGRSFDIGYLESGRLVNAGCKSLTFGGNRLIEETRKDIINKSTSGGTPSEALIKEAIKTGTLQRGAMFLPVADSIDSAKRRLAQDVMKGFNEIFQANRSITAESIALVLTVGGCFRETGQEGTETYVPSLTNYLQDEYNKSSEHTMFAQISEANPIAKGLVFYRVSQ